MDWTVVISELSGTFGMSQPEIATACGCGQSTVSGLATGVTKDPRHSTGQKLLALLEAKRREAEKKAVTSAAPAHGARAALQAEG
jgi:predicted transcriptional regulator